MSLTASVKALMCGFIVYPSYRFRLAPVEWTSSVMYVTHRVAAETVVLTS
jgi:hypothetical protein